MIEKFVIEEDCVPCIGSSRGKIACNVDMSGFNGYICAQFVVTNFIFLLIFLLDI